MPIVIDHNIPAYSILNHERIFVMDRERATKQDIRTIEIFILFFQVCVITRPNIFCYLNRTCPSNTTL